MTDKVNIDNHKINTRYINQINKILNKKILDSFWNTLNKEVLSKELEKDYKDRISPYKLVKKLLNE